MFAPRAVGPDDNLKTDHCTFRSQKFVGTFLKLTGWDWLLLYSISMLVGPIGNGQITDSYCQVLPKAFS